MSIALVTGAEGFIGRNLTIRLGELGHEVIPIGRGHDASDLADAA